MRRFVFYWFTFKLVCGCGSCPCFARKLHTERTVAQGPARDEYRQPPGFPPAAVHQHPLPGEVAGELLCGRRRGKRFGYTCWCQWCKNLRVFLTGAGEKGKRQGLTCLLAHCNQKQFCGEKVINILTRMVSPNSKVFILMETHILGRMIFIVFVFFLKKNHPECSCMSFSPSAQ